MKNFVCKNHYSPQDPHNSLHAKKFYSNCKERKRKGVGQSNDPFRGAPFVRHSPTRKRGHKIVGKSLKVYAHERRV